MRTTKSLGAAATAVAVLLLAACGAADDEPSANSTASASPAAVAATSSPMPTVLRTLPDGRTIGGAPSATGGAIPAADLPDLMLTYGDNGVEGYVERDALEGPEPSSPKEALEQQAKREPRQVPLYAADGVTVVGTYTVD